MNKLEKNIRAKMQKEYRYPHDIEVIAAEIYTWKVGNKLDIQPILVDFLQSVNCSTYRDIVHITYQYVKRLAQNQGKLLDEEYQKIAHLYDSIHIFVELGMEHDDSMLEGLERLMLEVLSKRGQAIFPNLDDTKPWWHELLTKYNENRKQKYR